MCLIIKHIRKIDIYFYLPGETTANGIVNLLFLLVVLGFCQQGADSQRLSLV